MLEGSGVTALIAGVADMTPVFVEHCVFGLPEVEDVHT